MKLEWSSRYFFGLFASTWPPEELDEFFFASEGLCMVYRDPWIAHERRISPFGLDAESEWRAVYRPSSCCWRLRRLRVLSED